MVKDLPCNQKQRIHRRFMAHVSQFRKWSFREVYQVVDDNHEDENAPEIE